MNVIGTGRDSKFCLQEERLQGVLGIPYEVPVESKAWFSRRRQSYMPNLAYIPFANAAAYDASPNALALTTVNGMFEANIDMRTIGWLLKGMFGAVVDYPYGDGYNHQFTPGKNERTFQILENKGGFNTPYDRKYKGMMCNRMTFNTGTNDYLWGSFGFLGLDETEVTGSEKTDFDGIVLGQGIPSPEESDMCVGNNQIAYYIGEAGKLTMGGIIGDPGIMGVDGVNRFVDIYDSRIDFTRPDAITDDFPSDGTGKPRSIFPGTFTPAINLMMKMSENHKLATFDARTRISLGIRFLVGVKSNITYMLDLIFPKCSIQAAPVDVQGSGQLTVVMQLLPEPTVSTSFSAKAILYNNIAAYLTPHV